MKRLHLISVLSLAAAFAIIVSFDSLAAANDKDNKKNGKIVKKTPKKDVKNGKADKNKTDKKSDKKKDGNKKDQPPNSDGRKNPAEVLNTVKDIIQILRGPGNGGIGDGGGGGGGDPGVGPPPPTDIPSPDQKSEPVDPPKDAKADNPKSMESKQEKEDPLPMQDETEPKTKEAPKARAGDVEEGEKEQPFTRRFLKVKNDTETTMRVYVQYRGLEDKKWTWIPADPSDAQDALVFELRPGQERILMHKGQKISASRARVWGVADSQSWLEYRDKDLWLVPEVDQRGEHRYLATDMRTFTHVFTPSSK